ncbi:Protein wntless homolog [Caenorhabditis elegans]|uniref:Protein wntless homolog n=1 Tax=Caenorhabditis elegans TaxID=6239 RepID=WLS_CAEEL|nr:Protein wntless homolog [Caenorhabditis elegans]Q7YWX7.1 RecName: Full=Protein wntless homolog; AltName: Full=Abnormal cell migration protein 14; Flags: Precursor [Caenorhabditis elegans]CAE17879.1 Protein wntless homolog [Caenorhabditis elegans]|eukprot:NP_001022275.1 Protein wntless homolog [Caenorhabditis elegans]
MAGGAVIENLSNRKLFVIFAGLLVIQIMFFLIGAWYAPSPSSYMEFEMITCRDETKGLSGEWIHRDNCQQISELSEYTPSSFDLREIVFIAKMPHTRDGIELEYSPWFQFLLGVLHVDVEYSEHFKYVAHAPLELEVRMGYRDKESKKNEWKELVTSNVTRILECTIAEDEKKAGGTYDCDMLDLFELGSSSYPFYLINIRIPINQQACQFDNKSANCQIGKLTGLRLIEIHQNGGFTLVWLWTKTFMTPVVAICLWWYYNRINQLARNPLLLERAILLLGLSLVILDFPIEWISLTYRIPFLLLISDLRQGLFYTVLFSFWLIFAGEHLIDDNTRNNLKSYRFNLSFIITASLGLLIYDLIERGIQLYDPFYSVWSSPTGSQIAYFAIFISAISTVAYFIFLFFKIARVWSTIKSKRSAQIYQTSENRRLKVEGVIYRFKFLMLFTLLCSAFTIAAYFMKQYGEAQLHGDEARDGFLTGSTSAFFTGAFGMCNIYVLLLLAMYAPSHKHYRGASQLIDENDDDEIMEDPSNQHTESNAMTTFLKPSTD